MSNYSFKWHKNCFWANKNINQFAFWGLLFLVQLSPIQIEGQLALIRTESQTLIHQR